MLLESVYKKIDRELLNSAYIDITYTLLLEMLLEVQTFSGSLMGRIDHILWFVFSKFIPLTICSFYLLQILSCIGSLMDTVYIILDDFCVSSNKIKFTFCLDSHLPKKKKKRIFLLFCHITTLNDIVHMKKVWISWLQNRKLFSICNNNVALTINFYDLFYFIIRSLRLKMYCRILICRTRG